MLDTSLFWGEWWDEWRVRRRVDVIDVITCLWTGLEGLVMPLGLLLLILPLPAWNLVKVSLPHLLPMKGIQ